MHSNIPKVTPDLAVSVGRRIVARLEPHEALQLAGDLSHAAFHAIAQREAPGAPADPFDTLPPAPRLTQSKVRR